MTRSIQHASTNELLTDLARTVPHALAKHTQTVLAIVGDPRLPLDGKTMVLEMIELFATDRFNWDMWEAAPRATWQECRVLLDRMRALDEPIPFALAEVTR